jgi:hypothetical protein
LTEGLDVVRKEQGLRPHPRGGERRFGPGMAATDNDDLKPTWKVHDFIDEFVRRRSCRKGASYGNPGVRKSSGSARRRAP